MYQYRFYNIEVQFLNNLLHKLPDKCNTDVLGFDLQFLTLAADIICVPLTFMFNVSFSIKCYQ